MVLKKTGKDKYSEGIKKLSESELRDLSEVKDESEKVEEDGEQKQNTV